MMFDHIRRSSRASAEAEKLALEAAEVSTALAGASAVASRTAAQLAEQARLVATGARGWASPHAQSALTWATPHATRAWQGAAGAVTPRVERAAERAVPLVDTAHDRLVEDLLPKFVAAITAAAAAASAGADKARDVTSAKLIDIAKIVEPEPKKSHTGATVVWVVAGVAVAGAAVAAWRRNQPMDDPWAEQPWEPFEEDGQDRSRQGGDAAGAVGEAAGGAVARTREASEKVAERAREAAERAREVARKATQGRRAGSTEGAGDLGSSDENVVPPAAVIAAGEEDTLTELQAAQSGDTGSSSEDPLGTDPLAGGEGEESSERS